MPACGIKMGRQIVAESLQNCTLYLGNLWVIGLKFTKFSYDVAASSTLLMSIICTWQYCNSLWNVNATSNFLRLPMAFKINWLTLQRPFGDHKANVSLIIYTHVSTNSENLV